jgi:Cd2+/Zn2+-exporting ATPase
MFALAIKTVFLVLALAGTATLWMAVFADMGASLRLLQTSKSDSGRPISLANTTSVATGT